VFHAYRRPAADPSPPNWRRSSWKIRGSVAPDHLTIQIGTNGQATDVKTDTSTTYHTQQPASAAAVTAGSKVLLQFNAPTNASGGSGQAPAPSGSPDAGGFVRAFGTVKDVTVLAR